MDNSHIKHRLKVCLKGFGGESRGRSVGSVDHLDGDFIKLRKEDAPDHIHHWIPTAWADRVDFDTLVLNVYDDEFYKGWHDVKPDTKAA